MWIEELTIKGYGALKDLSLEPAEGLNVVLGPAQSGKSSVANCTLDLLLGPGRWQGAEHGPRGAEARPQGGARFYARLRYRVGPGVSRLVQRDFERGVCRVQDETGAISEPGDGRAPGVVPPSLAATSPAGEAEEPPALVEARAAAGAWRHRMDRVRLAQAEERLKTLEALSGEEKALDEQLHALENSTLPRKDLEVLLESRRRLAATETEMAGLEARTGELKRAREALSAQMARLEPWKGASEAQVALVRDFESLQAGRRQATEKKKTLEGFLAQEADVSGRLESLAPRFKDIGTEAELDLVLSRLERDLLRDEHLATRSAEQKRLETLAAGHASKARMGMVAAAVGCLLAVGATVMLVKTFNVAYAVVLGVAGAIAAAGVGFKTGQERLAAEALSSLEPAAADVQKLTTQVATAREEVSTVLTRSGARTIHELRTMHREYCRLQRDLETVQGYIAGFKREVGEGGAGGGGADEAVALLKRCGLVKGPQEVTPQVIAAFVEGHEKLRTLTREAEGLDQEAREQAQALEARRKQAADLRAQQDRLLGGHTKGGEAGRAAAIEKLLARGNDLEKQLADLEKVRARLRELTPTEGGIEGLWRAAEDLRARIQRNEAEHESWRKLSIDAGALEQYQQNADDADAKVKALEEQGASVAGGPPPEVARALEGAARGLAETFKGITGLPLEMRLSLEEVAADVVAIPPAGLKLEVSRGQGAWTGSAMLGRTAAVLLDGLLPGEVQVQPGGGNLPIILDNPFVGLNEQRRDKAIEWLLRLASRRQVFFLTTEVADRDRLRKTLGEKRWTVREKQEGPLEFLSAAPASR